MNIRILRYVLIIIFLPVMLRGQQLADLVNPLVGTAAEGQTYPGVGMPFGMTQWTPATQDTERKGVVPYYYADQTFRGIRGSHFLSGSAMQDYGSFQLLAGSDAFPWQGHAPASRFSHDQEHATPYLYKVELPDLGVTASVTGTTRCGLLRFAFHRGNTAWIDVQNNARAGDGSLTIDTAHNEIVGWSKVRRIYAGQGKLAGFSGYVVVEFDHPFHVGGTWSGAEAPAVSSLLSTPSSNQSVLLGREPPTDREKEPRAATSLAGAEVKKLPLFVSAVAPAVSVASWTKSRPFNGSCDTCCEVMTWPKDGIGVVSTATASPATVTVVVTAAGEARNRARGLAEPGDSDSLDSAV